MSIFDMFNIFAPIKQHFTSLKEDSSTGGVFVIFGMLPLAAVIFFNTQDLILFNYDIANTLLTIFSILIGFTISILTLLLEYVNSGADENVRQLHKHTYYNTNYLLILGILILIFGIITYPIMLKKMMRTQTIVVSAIYFLIANYLLTLLLIVKRYSKLFDKKISTRITQHQ